MAITDITCTPTKWSPRRKYKRFLLLLTTATTIHNIINNTIIMPEITPIDAAVEELHMLPRLRRGDITKIASKFDIKRNTLSDHYHGKHQTIESRENHQILTNEQEEALIQWIGKLTNRGFPPESQLLRQKVIQLRLDMCPPGQQHLLQPLGVNWVTTFWKRHQDLLGHSRLRRIDKTRQWAINREIVVDWFDLVYMDIIFSRHR